MKKQVSNHSFHPYVAKLEAKNDKLKDKLKSALADYRETFTQLAQAEEKTASLSRIIDRAAKDCEEKLNKNQEITRLKDALDAASMMMFDLRNKLSREVTRAEQAEALVGRIAIKRDRRSR